MFRGKYSSGLRFSVGHSIIGQVCLSQQNHSEPKLSFAIENGGQWHNQQKNQAGRRFQPKHIFKFLTGTSCGQIQTLNLRITIPYLYQQQTSSANVIKSVWFITDGGQNKLECLSLTCFLLY
jgi:hypothetical protein